MVMLVMQRRVGTGAVVAPRTVNVPALATDDRFGWSVAMGTTYAIVGAPTYKDGADEAGRAWIVDIASGDIVHTLTNPDTDSPDEDSFGRAVDISDSYAIVGAAWDGALSGKAYIFSTTTGALLHTIPSGGMQTGIGVAITETHALVGISGGGANQTGYARVYNPATGALIRNINNPNATGSGDFDLFGYTVALTDTYAVISAFGEDLGASGAGAVYSFTISDGVYKDTLSQPSPALAERYGLDGALSADGNYAVVGSYKDATDGDYSGQVYVFNLSTGARMYTLENPNAYDTPLYDSFGFSTTIKGDYIIVGAHGEDEDGATDSGKVYVYHIPSLPAYSGTEITVSTATFVIDNPNAYDTPASDSFGYSVATNGTDIMIGVPTEDSASGTTTGAVYIKSVASL